MFNIDREEDRLDGNKKAAAGSCGRGGSRNRTLTSALSVSTAAMDALTGNEIVHVSMWAIHVSGTGAKQKPRQLSADAAWRW